MEIQGYGFAEGAVFQKGANTADPQKVGECINAIRRQLGGKLKADDIVSAASDPTSPLHSFFEWDDSEAAHQYRLQQARHLIRTVVAVYKELPDREPVRAFVHISANAATLGMNGNGEVRFYTGTADAVAQPELKRIVLEKAKADLASWRRRYRDIVELSEVLASVIDAETSIEAMLIPNAIKYQEGSGDAA